MRAMRKKKNFYEKLVFNGSVVRGSHVSDVI